MFKSKETLDDKQCRYSIIDKVSFFEDEQNPILGKNT
jgi:hypothetical protein